MAEDIEAAALPASSGRVEVAKPRQRMLVGAVDVDGMAERWKIWLAIGIGAADTLVGACWGHLRRHEGISAFGTL